MQEILNRYLPNVMERLPAFGKAIGDTLVMVAWSGSIAFVLGLVLGVVLIVTRPGGILENKVLYQVLDKVINFFRSIPFIILLTWVIPLSRAIMGTAIDVPGAIVPLVLPKLYVTVWVNEDEAREIYIVPPLPRAVDAMLMVDLLGTVYNATV